MNEEEKELRQRLRNINLCIREIINKEYGYEFLDTLFRDKTRIGHLLKTIEEEKEKEEWIKIWGEEMWTIEQLRREIDDINNKEFTIKTADHLTQKDYRYLDKLHTRKMEVKSKLEKAYTKYY